MPVTELLRLVDGDSDGVGDAVTVLLVDAPADTVALPLEVKLPVAVEVAVEVAELEGEAIRLALLDTLLVAVLDEVYVLLCDGDAVREGVPVTAVWPNTAASRL